MRFQYRYYHYYAAEEEEETEFFYPFSTMVCDQVVFRNMFSGEKHENFIFFISQYK